VTGLPPAFHVMAKPTGSRCNSACDYCFFLSKAQLYPGSRFRMSDAVMESYVRQTLESQRAPVATICWQGGEPTLMGIDFFRRSIEVEKKAARHGLRVERTLQTNGLLLDDTWCEFLRKREFLVGLSLDGPQALHDAHRRDKAGRSVFERVVRSARLLQAHGVPFNILCAVHATNAGHPLEVYRFFRDELGARFLQFIPIVERDNASGAQRGTRLTPRSVPGEAYGRFLIALFDEWLRRDVGSMFVQIFDATLASFVRGCSSLCVFRPTCGDAVVLEHNGDLYSCDHFVEPRHLLGNILRTPLVSLVGSRQQRRFAEAKSATLPAFCKQCEFLFACHGECPKNRVLRTPDGERGLNWLCLGLRAFFRHVEHPMRRMAELLRQGRDAAEITTMTLTERG
jgi:uncharacterized protein